MTWRSYVDMLAGAFAGDPGRGFSRRRSGSIRGWTRPRQHTQGIFVSQFRLTPSLVVATLALLVSASGFAVASTLTPSGTIAACASKRTAVLRLAPRSGRCAPGERAVVWSQRGPAGPGGQGGPVGQAGGLGPAGPAGSPDTAAQVLAKIKQVDGQGSGLDADTLKASPRLRFFQSVAPPSTRRTSRVHPGLMPSSAGES